MGGAAHNVGGVRVARNSVIVWRWGVRGQWTRPLAAAPPLREGASSVEVAAELAGDYDELVTVFRSSIYL